MTSKVDGPFAAGRAELVVPHMITMLATANEAHKRFNVALVENFTDMSE